MIVQVASTTSTAKRLQKENLIFLICVLPFGCVFLFLVGICLSLSHLVVTQYVDNKGIRGDPLFKKNVKDGK